MPTGGISFDWAVHFGDIMQAVTFLSAAISLAAYMRMTITEHAKRLDKIDTELARQTDILVKLATGEQRMSGLEHRLDLLERRGL